MILLTGGAGLIGSAILWRLNELGRDDIVVVDHLAEGEKWQNIRPARFSDYFEKDDFQRRLEAGQFEGAFTDIIHLGACRRRAPPARSWGRWTPTVRLPGSRSTAWHPAARRRGKEISRASRGIRRR